MKAAALILSLILSLQNPSASPASLEAQKETEAVIELPIVMYHNISPKQKYLGKYVISPRQFEGDLCYLKGEGYETITVKQLFAWYEGSGELPEKPIMLTFDDGFESSLLYALPLLEKYEYKAVVGIIGSIGDKFSGNENRGMDFSHLSWDGIRELQQSGIIEIQSHSFNMHKTDSRNGMAKKRGESTEDYFSALKNDHEEFIKICNDNGVTPVESIALPFGAFSKETFDILNDIGIKAIFTCTEKVNKLKGNPEELFKLKRFNRPHGKSSETFFKSF